MRPWCIGLLICASACGRDGFNLSGGIDLDGDRDSGQANNGDGSGDGDGDDGPSAPADPADPGTVTDDDGGDTDFDLPPNPGTLRWGRTVTVSTSGIASPVPSLVVPIRPNGMSFDFNNVRNDGQDIFFIDAVGASLAYELAPWSTAYHVIWVRTSPFAANDPTAHFFFNYGNDAITDSGIDPVIAWQGYEVVLHFESTTNNSSPMAHTEVNATHVYDIGQVGYSLQDPACISLDATTSVGRGADGYVIDGWFNVRTIPTTATVITGLTAPGSGLTPVQIKVRSSGSAAYSFTLGIQTTASDTQPTVDFADSYVVGGWNFVSAFFDVANRTVSLWVNGSLRGTVDVDINASVLPDEPMIPVVRGSFDCDNVVDVWFDELRMQRGTLEDAEAQMRYRVQTNGVSIGDEGELL